MLFILLAVLIALVDQVPRCELILICCLQARRAVLVVVEARLRCLAALSIHIVQLQNYWVHFVASSLLVIACARGEADGLGLLIWRVETAQVVGDGGPVGMALGGLSAFVRDCCVDGGVKLTFAAFLPFWETLIRWLLLYVVC